MTVFTQGIFHRSYPGTDTIKTEIIRPIFGSCPQYIDNIKTDMTSKGMDVNGVITAVYNIASAVVDEDRLNIYEVQVSDNVLMQRNKVGVKKAVSNYINEGEGALMFVYCPSKPEEWRISYITRDSDENSPSKRYTYLVGENEPCVTVTQRFNILAQRDELSRESIADAFSVEALSDEFFDNYRALYANFVQYVTGNRVVKTGSKWEEKKMHDPNPTLYAAFGNDDKRIRDYVKKLMGRITFLYFVQKKGWFNGDQNYLQHLFETSQYKYDFLDRVLEPFFYTVLNTEQPNRKQAFDDHNRNLKSSEVEWDVNLLDQWNDIPFLNGGLFERDENDIVRSQFPSQFFKNENGYDENFVNKIPAKDKGYTWDNIPGIFDLFAQYNFTIDENDPNEAEVGIDPEMLGKIFENLLEDNKEKGAFYTPKEIVQYMCKESLIAYLQTDAKDDAHKQRLRDFVTKHDVTILQDPAYVRQKIKDIKICDPAIGSGAFPMGMLNELVICTEALDNHIDKKVNRAEIKKHIIQNSIYGVDIERGAVDIARLRFWLSLVIDEEKAIPLPNLDYKIMQGNSLLEQYEGIDLSKLKQASPTIKEVKPHRNLFGEIEEQQLSITFNNNADNLSYALNQYYNCRQHEAKTRYKNLIENNIKKIIEYNFGVQIEIHQNTIDLESALVEKNKNELTSIKATLDNNNSQLSVLSKKQNLTPNEKLQVTNLKKAIDNANKQYVGLNSSINESKKKINYATNEKQRYEKALDSIQQIDLSANQQFFLWHTWFADVFNRSSNQGGFDIVIGNPPYVFARSSEEKGMTKEIKGIYYNHFDLAKYQVNLYHLFIEQGTNLLSNNGIFAYIVPNNWMTINTNKELRKYILEKSDIKIVNFYKRVFEHADVDSSIIIFNNQSTSDSIINLFEAVSLTDIKLIKKTQSSYFFTQKDYVINIELFKDGSFAGILNKIENASKELKEIADVKCGLGAYGIDKGNPPQTKEMIAKRVYHSKRKEGKEWFMYIEGEDVKRYLVTWTNEEYLKWGKHLREPRNNWDLFSTPRILVRQIPSKLPYCINACYTETTFLNDRNSMNVIYIKENPKYVLGVLNSKALSFWFAHKFGKLQRGLFPQFKINELASFPIPSATAAQQKPIIDFVDQILAAKKNNPQADTSELECEIDKKVYQLYGLTEEEIRIVEQK